MKKNVPSDALEEFLQNAMEGYSESPSDEVWGRIAADVKAAPAPRFGIKMPTRVWIGLAAAGIAGVILYQIIHVNQTLNHINHSVEAQQAEIRELQEQNQDKKTLPQTTIENAQANIENEKYHKSRNTGDANEDLERTTANTQGLMQKKASPNFYADKKQRNIASNQKLFPKNNANTFVENRANPLVSSSTNETIYSDPSIPTVGAVSSEALPPAVANEDVQSLLKINPLAGRSQQIQFSKGQDKINIPVPLELPIQRAKAKMGMYVGANVLPMQYWSQVSPKRTPPVPMHNRKAFNQKDQQNGNAFAMGLNIGKKLTKHWSVESGAMYRSSSITATHEPEFKFKDRDFPPHSDPRNAHFEYDLNTSSGTVALAITVASNSTMIPEDEEIELEITSEQSLAYLSVPLLLNYQLGNGRFHLNAKGGFLTNFLLDSDFNITNIFCENINFKPEPNRPYESEALYINALSLDYLLQIGMAYDVNRNLSFNISPSFIGSLSNPSSNRFIQSSNYSAGISAGVNWNF